jgi:hypothetical protein
LVGFFETAAPPKNLRVVPNILSVSEEHSKIRVGQQ